MASNQQQGIREFERSLTKGVKEYHQKHGIIPQGSGCSYCQSKYHSSNSCGDKDLIIENEKQMKREERRERDNQREGNEAHGYACYK